jgi:hypothetical protein
MAFWFGWMASENQPFYLGWWIIYGGCLAVPSWVKGRILQNLIGKNYL